jgi:hypothetical protein
LSELQSTINSVKGGLTDGLPATLGESMSIPFSPFAQRINQANFDP